MAEDTTTKVKSLKQELRETIQLAQQLAGQGLTNDAAYTNAIARAGELRDTIGDVNDQVNVLSGGSQFEKLGNSIGDVGSKLANLDFGGAAESASQLVAISKQMTFKTALGAIKDVGKTFLDLGKALLLNPFFLIVGVAVAIGVALFKLKDKVKIIGDVFDFLGGIIDAVVQGFKDLTDWLGLTNNAAEDLAEKQAEQAEKVAKASEIRSKTVIQGLDNEIKMAELQGKNTDQLQKKKLQSLRELSIAEYKRDKAAFDSAVLKGELDKKELADLREKVVLSKLAAQQTAEDIKFFDAKIQKTKEDGIAKDQEATKNANKKANDDAKAYRQDRLNAARQLKDLELANLEDGIEKELAINTEKYKRLIEDVKRNEKLTSDERKKISIELATQESESIIKIKNDNNDKLLAADKELNDQKIAAQKIIDDAAIEKAQFDKEQATEEFLAKAELNAINLEGKLAQLEAERTIELEQKNLTESEKALIDQKYSEQKLELIEAERQAKIAAAQEDLDLAQKGLDSVQALTDVVFANKLAKVEKGSKEEEKLARKQFQINKAMQLGGAVIDASKAVLSSLAASPIAIGPVPNPAGIASLAFVAASSIANIAKISSAKFGGGSPAASPTPNIPAPASAENSSAPAQPSFNLFGQGNDANTVGPGSVNGNTQQNINVNSTVSVTEINATQNKVKVIEERSSL